MADSDLQITPARPVAEGDPFAEKTIVLATAHPWNSPLRLSGHHLIHAAARQGWRSLFLTSPATPLHFVASVGRASARARVDGWREGILTIEPNLLAYTPFAALGPAGSWPLNSLGVIRHWPKFTLPQLRHVLARAGFWEPSLLVIDAPTWLPLPKMIRPKRLVVRMLDNMSGFRSSSEAILTAERQLVRMADITVVSGKGNESRARALGARTIAYVPHGIDVSHFSSRGLGEPEEIAHLARPRVLYVGAVDEWLDTDAILFAAKSRPDWSIVVVGPGHVHSAPLRDCANVHILGPKAYDDVPAFMQWADVGIIPFRGGAFLPLTTGINPLKLFEYLAAGLPVVAARLESIEATGAPVFLYEPDDKSGFVRAIDAALARGACLDTQDFLAGRSWDGVFQRILASLDPPGES